MKAIRDFMDQSFDELDELLSTVIESNSIDYIDESLISILYHHYVYYKIKSYVWFLLSCFASAVATVCIISEEILNLPRLARIVLSLAIIFRIPINKIQIRDYIMGEYGKTAVKYFKENMDLWHSKNSDSKEE